MYDYDNSWRRLRAIVDAGQWNGMAPKPTLAARLDAQKAYDALQLLDPESLRPWSGWRIFVWRLIAALRG